MKKSVHFSSLCTELLGQASCWQPGAGNTLEQVCLSRGASHPTMACAALPACWCQCCSGELGPSLNGWPEEGRLLLCSLEGGAGFHTTALDVLLITAPWMCPQLCPAGPPVPAALPIWTAVTEKTAPQPPWQHGFHLGCTQKGRGTGFITASVLSQDAPLATNQIFPWSRQPQDYIQCHSESTQWVVLTLQGGEVKVYISLTALVRSIDVICSLYSLIAGPALPFTSPCSTYNFFSFKSAQQVLLASLSFLLEVGES